MNFSISSSSGIRTLHQLVIKKAYFTPTRIIFGLWKERPSGLQMRFSLTMNILHRRANVLRTPLNLKCANPEVKEEDELYETVVFFKWLEEKYPMAIQNIIEDHSALTHSSITPTIKNRNTVGAFYLDSITNTYPELSFLDFAKNALYWKDFAKNETKETDLWGAEYLGPPEESP